MKSNNYLGNAIRQARMDKHITQEGLAEMVEITPIHLKLIEGGQRKPSVPVLFKLAKILEFSIDSIVVDSDRVENQESTNALKADVNYLLTKCNKKELNLIIDITKDIIKNR